MKEPLKGFTVTANNGLDFSKATLLYSYFNDDSTLKRTDTLLTFDKQPNGNDYKLTVTKSANAAKKTGYFLVSNIQDTTFIHNECSSKLVHLKSCLLLFILIN
jgi:hypothetical protein